MTNQKAASPNRFRRGSVLSAASSVPSTRTQKRLTGCASRRRARPTARGQCERRRRFSTAERGTSAASDCSFLNFSDHATSGLQRKKFTPMTMTAMVRMARATLPEVACGDRRARVRADAREACSCGSRH